MAQTGVLQVRKVDALQISNEEYNNQPTFKALPSFIQG